MAEVDDWTVWLNRHGSTLLLLARQWASSSADAGDIVQDAFLRFWRSRREVADPAAYLYACLKRSAIDFQRAEMSRRRRERIVAREESSGGWFGDQAEQDGRVAEIEGALRQLPADQREVLTMKIWGRLTFEQIGSALDVSPHTAASRYRYALEKLRAQLSDPTRLQKESVP